MCGLVGFSGEYSLNDLNKSINIIRHRGPDSDGVFFNKESQIGLGFVRLAIQDLSPAGDQPMQSQDKDIILVFNGEIYNVEELREDLKLKGCNFNSSSDTEVLLNGYIQYGLDFIPKLNGIFSIALLDIKKEEIYLIRDAFGIKPLYLYQDEKGILFSSEIKAFLPFTRLNLNKDSVPYYLKFLWNPSGNKIAENVSLIEPGSILTIKNKLIVNYEIWHHHKKYFNAPKLKLKSPEHISNIRKLLSKSVSRQMISDAPLGAFLSGGLDSSAVVAFARESNPNLQCFTIKQEGGVDIGQTDDYNYAHRVANYLNLPLNTVKISSDDLIENIESMIWMLDEPLADPAALNVYFISKFANKMGIKVLLSGAGGDDIFTGYRRHMALKWINTFNLHKLRFLLKPNLMPKSFFKHKLLSEKVTKFLKPIQANNANEMLFNFFSWTDDELINKLLCGQPISSSEQLIYKPFARTLDSISSNDYIDKILALELRHFLNDHNLIYTDKMSMATGVEVRVPLLDKEFVEYILSIPNDIKQTLFQGKSIFKKAMEDILPREVIYRPKTGFSAPLKRWIKDDFNILFERYLSRDVIEELGIFHYDNLQSLISENKRGNIDAAYTIFSVLCIHIWAHKFIA